MTSSVVTYWPLLLLALLGAGVIAWLWWETGHAPVLPPEQRDYVNPGPEWGAEAQAVVFEFPRRDSAA